MNRYPVVRNENADKVGDSTGVEQREMRFQLEKRNSSRNGIHFRKCVFILVLYCSFYRYQITPGAFQHLHSVN